MKGFTKHGTCTIRISGIERSLCNNMSAGYYQNGDSASLSKVSKLDDTASQFIKNIQDF